MTAKTLLTDIPQMMKDSRYFYSVNYLAKYFQVSKVTIRKYLRILEEKNLVTIKKSRFDGRELEISKIDQATT